MNQRKLIVVNLFTGPGSGKSTIAAGVFEELKWNGINCELVSEFAKQEVWAGNKKSFMNQLFITGNQHHKQLILVNEVDIIVTDSPILLGIVYNRAYSDRFAFGPSLEEVLLEAHNMYDNMNYFIQRTKPYETKGRNQNESEARELDAKIQRILTEKKIPYKHVIGDRQAKLEIVADIMARLNCA